MTIASEAKYKTIHAEGSKIFTPKQMLWRLPIALAQVTKAIDNEEKKLLKST